MHVVDAIKQFDDFQENNDPWGEHDFGKVEVDGKSFYFKIDYYDRHNHTLAPDPSDPETTRRVMTILLQEEW